MSSSGPDPVQVNSKCLQCHIKLNLFLRIRRSGPGADSIIASYHHHHPPRKLSLSLKTPETQSLSPNQEVWWSWSPCSLFYRVYKCEISYETIFLLCCKKQRRHSTYRHGSRKLRFSCVTGIFQPLPHIKYDFIFGLYFSKLPLRHTFVGYDMIDS